jgi:hypothetical protein
LCPTVRACRRCRHRPPWGIGRQPRDLSYKWQTAVGAATGSGGARCGLSRTCKMQSIISGTFLRDRGRTRTRCFDQFRIRGPGGPRSGLFADQTFWRPRRSRSSCRHDTRHIRRRSEPPSAHSMPIGSAGIYWCIRASNGPGPPCATRPADSKMGGRPQRLVQQKRCRTSCARQHRGFLGLPTRTSAAQGGPGVPCAQL